MVRQQHRLAGPAEGLDAGFKPEWNRMPEGMKLSAFPTEAQVCSSAAHRPAVKAGVASLAARRARPTSFSRRIVRQARVSVVVEPMCRTEGIGADGSPAVVCVVTRAGAALLIPTSPAR